MTDGSITARITVDHEKFQEIIDEAIEHIKESGGSPLDYPHLDVKDVIRATAEEAMEEAVTLEFEEDP